MNPKDLNFILAMTCVIPAVAGLIRFRNISSNYFPFIFLMIMDVAMETIFRLSEDASLIFCIYVVASFGLLLYFVFLNGFVGRKAIILFVIAIVLAVINFLFYEVVCRPFLNEFTNMELIRSIYLLCFTGVVMLFIWIDVLSRQISVVNSKLKDNCWFWISASYTLSISFNLLIFSLYIFAISNTPNAKSIGNIQHYVNALCYLLFTIAVLKMPAKPESTKTKAEDGKIEGYAI